MWRQLVHPPFLRLTTANSCNHSSSGLVSRPFIVFVPFLGTRSYFTAQLAFQSEWQPFCTLGSLHLQLSLTLFFLQRGRYQLEQHFSNCGPWPTSGIWPDFWWIVYHHPESANSSGLLNFFKSEKPSSRASSCWQVCFGQQEHDMTQPGLGWRPPSRAPSSTTFLLTKTRSSMSTSSRGGLFAFKKMWKLGNPEVLAVTWWYHHAAANIFWVAKLCTEGGLRGRKVWEWLH